MEYTERAMVWAGAKPLPAKLMAAFVAAGRTNQAAGVAYGVRLPRRKHLLRIRRNFRRLARRVWQSELARKALLFGGDV